MTSAKRNLGFSTPARSTKRMKTANTLTVRTSEVKEFLGQSGTAVPAASIANIQLGAGIVQGVGTNQRIGNRIRLKSIEVWGSMGQQASGSLPITTTLFNAKSVAAFTPADYVGPFVYDDSGTVYDIAWNVTGANVEPFMFKKTFSGRGKIITFDKDSGVPTHDHPNLLINNQSAASTSFNAVYWRLRYVDY